MVVVCDDIQNYRQLNWSTIKYGYKHAKNSFYDKNKTTIWDNSANDTLMIFFFFFFSQTTGLDISCKLSPLETICMKCQILFSGKIRKILQYVVC